MSCTGVLSRSMEGTLIHQPTVFSITQRAPSRIISARRSPVDETTDPATPPTAFPTVPPTTSVTHSSGLGTLRPSMQAMGSLPRAFEGHGSGWHGRQLLESALNG